MMSRARAEALGLAWLAEVGAYGNVAGPDPSLVVQPARAIRDALRRDALHGVALGRDDAALTLDDIDLFEINEAFAGVALASSAELGVSADITNVNGGAIALGHPVGMSGARIVLALALELRRRGGGVGAAALCGGGGQGDALIIRVPAKA
jgi:acetyl-CoA C-acetyltransferase